MTQTEAAKPNPLFSEPCVFIAGAGSLESLPPISVPEIAFIGRSNAGKSTLLNALVGEKDLARVSANPGMTKQLNFFLLGKKSERVLDEMAPPARRESRSAFSGHIPHAGKDPYLMLVDMPGYGFAPVSKGRKSEWDNLIRSYLLGRTSLKRTCVLIDARRGVMKVDDDFMRLLDDSAVNFQIVVTKIDALTGKDLSVLLKSMDKTIGSHVAAHPQVIATSSLRKEGIYDLQNQLAAFA